MTPQLLDAIADACCRIIEAMRLQPKSAKDQKAKRIAAHLMHNLKPVYRGQRQVSPQWVLHLRCRELADRLQRIAQQAAQRIDASRPKPVTSGPVGDGVHATDAQLDRWEQQRLEGARGRALRGMRT